MPSGVFPSQEVYFSHPLLPARDWQDRPQLEEVCRWWREVGTGICALIGIGGAGKTAIADRFLQILPDALPPRPHLPKRVDLKSPERLFVFSFYEAPTTDSFFAALSTFLCLADARKDRSGEPETNHAASYEQIRLALQSAGLILMVLDGLEKVQDDGVRGGVFGDLTDGRLTDLVLRVADGLLPRVSILITSRFPMAKLDEGRSDFFLSVAIEELDEVAAISLLRQRGVRGTDNRLSEIARDCGLHALTVNLAGGYIAEFGGGDPATPLALTRFDDEDQARRAEPTNPRRRAVRLQEYRFARIAESYRCAFRQHDPVALALMERVCLFRLGVTAEALASIFIGDGEEKRRIAGAALAGLTREQLDCTLKRLIALKLIECNACYAKAPSASSHPSLTIHPAVRDGFSMRELEPESLQLCHTLAQEFFISSLGGLPARKSNPSCCRALDVLEEVIHHAIEAGQVTAAWNIYWRHIGGFENLGRRLGAFDRGRRICTLFSGISSPSSAMSCLSGSVGENKAEGQFAISELPLRNLSDRDRAQLFFDWGLYLRELGHGLSADICFCHFTTFFEQRETWKLASIGMQNRADICLRAGRLIKGGMFADEAFGYAEQANDKKELKHSVSLRARSAALRGELATSGRDFRIALVCQHQEEGILDRPLHCVWGIWHAQLKASLGCSADAMALVAENVRVLCELFGEEYYDIPKCRLLLSEVGVMRGDLENASINIGAARAWAVARDAKEILCWLALVQGRLESSIGNLQAVQQRQQRLNSATRSIEDGLKIARNCGYGIYHIDLLIEQARVHLLKGQPHAALDDLQMALDDGVAADAHSGQPELVAATNAECGYVWGIAEGLSLRGEALLVQAAQLLGCNTISGKPLTADSEGIPHESDSIAFRLIERAESCLNQAMQRWHELRDPEPNNANFRHPQTGAEYNFRAAATYRILTDLTGGKLTRYPLETVPLSSVEMAAPSQAHSEESTAIAPTYKYDALISYRRQDPDKAFARDLLRRLENAGLKVAIDERDFDPVAMFLEEMERCIKESRYTLAVMSPRYLESGSCEEEAIICRVLDMTERRRRIIPLTIEAVTMPYWLYNIVGVNFTDPDPLVDPHRKLMEKLQNPY